MGKRIKKNKAVHKCEQLAISFIECELHILSLRISNPELNSTDPDKNYQSPFYWNCEKVDLCEIVIALDRKTAFVDRDGNKIPFSTLIRSVEKLLNIELGEPREIKRIIAKRKSKGAVFIESMVKELKNLQN